MNEWTIKNTHAFVEPGKPFSEGLGAVLWGRVLCTRGSASPIQVQILPGVQRQAVRQDTGSSDALDVGPSLGNTGLAWWNGSPGSSRKLPKRLPRQEIENNPVLFFCLPWVGPLPASWFWLQDFRLHAKHPRTQLRRHPLDGDTDALPLNACEVKFA